MKQRCIRKLFGGLLVCALLYIPLLMLFSVNGRLRSGYERTDPYNTTTAQMTTEQPTHSPYEKNVLTCNRNYTVQTASTNFSLPKRYSKNIPPVSYRTCGIGDLIRPRLDKSQKYWMIFLVKSAPKHFTLRETLRHTWATVSEISGKKFTTIFLLGRPTEANAYQQELLEEESRIYGDILQCDVIDSYYNLTVKVLSTFRWLLQTELESKHYTFCDDDTTMNMAATFIYFAELDQRNATDTTVCGFKHHANGSAVRDITSKWYMREDLYDVKAYPTFCHGAMWTISSKLLHDFYCVAETTESSEFYLDDVYITGVLRHKLYQSEKSIHPPIIFNNTPIDLMFYPWGEGRRRYINLKYKWEIWKILLTSSEPLLTGTDIRIEPKTVQYRSYKISGASKLRIEWERDRDAYSPWVVCVIVLVAFVCPYGLFILLFIYVSRTSSTTLVNQKVLYSELDSNNDDILPLRI